MKVRIEDLDNGCTVSICDGDFFVDRFEKDWDKAIKYLVGYIKGRE